MPSHSFHWLGALQHFCLSVVVVVVVFFGGGGGGLTILKIDC